MNERDAFSGFHPSVNLVYFALVLAITMCVMQPVFLLLSLLSGCCYLYYLRGGRGFCRQVGYLLPLLLAMALLNPLFNHEGLTILAYLPNDNPITLEAIVYGLAASAMMGAAVVWFNCLTAVFTSDKIIYLFGRVIPALSLLISMTLRFVPRFKGYLQNVLRVQQGLHKPETLRQRLSQALGAFSATVSWALEQSIVSADSMKSRGYGSARRTAFSIYRFDRRDGLSLLLMLLLAGAGALPVAFGAVRWLYYPGLSGNLTGALPLTSYVCFAGLCSLPLLINLREDRKWNSLQSKI